MDKVERLKGSCCCMVGDEILYTTDNRHMLLAVNKYNGNTIIREQQQLKGRAMFILPFGEELYVVDTNTEWIGHIVKGEEVPKYYSLKPEMKNNIRLAIKVGENIVFVLKNEFTFVEFDTNKKQLKEPKRKNIDVKSIDCACSYGSKIWIFSSQEKRYIVYDFKQDKVLETYSIELDNIINYVIRYKEQIYILSRNTVYKVDKGIEKIVKIESDEILTRLCITDKNIWIMPGNGEHIFIYDIESQVYKEFTDYPKDFMWTIKGNNTKFAGRCEDAERIYWIMRGCNYIMSMDKHSGCSNMIMIKNIHENDVINKILRQNNGVIVEGEMALREFINYNLD